MPLGICPACENERTLDLAGRIDFHLTRDADGCLDVCEGVRHEPLPPKPSPSLCPWCTRPARLRADGTPEPHHVTGGDGVARECPAYQPCSTCRVFHVGLPCNPSPARALAGGPASPE